MEPEQISGEHRARFAAAATAQPPYPAERFAGRGIVICAGGARLFTCAYVAIGILRRVLGCRLPIEVWHLGPQEIGPPMRALLEEQGVELVDALALARSHPVRTLGGWELKPYAILHTRFREVLLVDADNVPAVDPAFLFDSAEYAEAGAIFWPDIVRLKPSSEIWRLCGLEYCSLPTVESGQILVDKRRCWAALQLTMHMNEHSDFYYEHLHGDKDTFFIAWRRLGQPYAMTAHLPVLVQGVLFQRDFAGATLFQHRTQAKWTYDGNNPRVAGFRLEAECFALLAELRERWNGRVFLPPAATPAAARATAELERAEWFDFVRLGEAETPLQLLTANRIGAGRDDAAFYWHVEEDGEGLALVLEGRRRTGYRLRPQPTGQWSGGSLGPEGGGVDLHPRPSWARGAVGVAASEPERRLLDRLIAAAMADPPGGLADLAGALRLLTRSESGFAAAIAVRLSAGEGGAALQGCLRAALDEARRVAVDAPLSGHGSRQHYWNLNSQYERID